MNKSWIAIAMNKLPVILRALARRLMRSFSLFRMTLRNKGTFLLLRSMSPYLAVSFTNLFTPFGRINWEFVANDLPLFFRKKTLKNRVRAS